MLYTVYKTTNTITNKSYIGVHRMKGLDDDYMGSGKHLLHSIKHHGIENFNKEILFIFDNEQDMLNKEQWMVV